MKCVQLWEGLVVLVRSQTTELRLKAIALMANLSTGFTHSPRPSTRPMAIPYIYPMRLQHAFPILFSAIIISMTACSSEPETYTSLDDYPVYVGDDLGVNYTSEHTDFRLWSPVANEVTIRIYKEGLGGDPVEEFKMSKANQGTWTASAKGDYAGMFYTFQVRERERLLPESPGPYARAVGVNGERGAIIDLDTTDPPGWDGDKRPALEDFGDIIVYEIQVRGHVCFIQAPGP